MNPLVIEFKRGEIVLTPQGRSCTVLGVSMAGRATIRDEEGIVIAINADQLRKVTLSSN